MQIFYTDEIAYKEIQEIFYINNKFFNTANDNLREEAMRKIIKKLRISLTETAYDTITFSRDFIDKIDSIL